MNQSDTQPQRAFPWEEGDELARYQPLPVSKYGQPRKRARFKLPTGCIGGCLSMVLLAAFVVAAIVLVISQWPGQTLILVLGVDDRAEGSYLGRTDTIVLAGFGMQEPQVRLLSIPRDLWVFIPGVGENRINTAHYFGEINAEGGGVVAATETIETNFGVQVDGTVRVRFDSLKKIVEILGGVSVNLPEPMSGYDAGEVKLSADEALAFVRDRSSGDDFGRMLRGQIFIRGLIGELLNPLQWVKMPVLVAEFNSALDAQIGWLDYARIAVALYFAYPDGIDGQVITREMTSPFQTDQGAQVLGPRWELILPVTQALFPGN